MTDVYCYAKNVPRVTEYVFWLTNIKSSVLHVPAASIQQYKNHKEWGKFGKIVRIEPLIQYIIDGEIYKTVIIPEGDAITLEEEPEKEGHTFSGWSEIPTTMPAEDVTVTGSFIPNKYTLTYIVDGEIYKTFEVTYGERITAEKEPQKEKFVFSGWSEIPITMPANDVTITGFFTFGEFQLTYIVDGEPYKIICLDYGTKIIAEMEPEKQGYTFSGWSEIPAKMPAKNVTVTGSFTINKYRLIYMVDDEIYRTYDIDYGAVITSEAEPTKEGYTFSGWSEIPSTMSSMDVIVTGSFTINKYTLTYKVDDEIYKNYEVEYGSDITPENAPTKEGYTFSGWSDIPAIMPAEDVTITGFL